MSLRRYIFRQLIIATLLVAIIFTCMVWLNQSVRFVDLIVNRGLSYTDFLSLVTLLLPTFIYVVLPIPAFVAVVYVYNKLESDHELVVMRSAGLSALTLARPALALGLVLSIASFALSLYLVPASYRNFKDMQQLARSNYAAVLVSAGVFNNMGDGLTVFVRERNGGGVQQGLLIHDQRDADAPVTIMAEQGTIIQGPNGPRIVLING
ncbi:MAG: LptF/LptG family permease, partial [Alphaproteobacteria bacterium]